MRDVATTVHSCHGEERRESVLRTQAEWDAWLARAGCGEPLGAVVDFATEVVVAVEDVPGMNSCRLTRISGARETDGRLVVDVVRTKPGPGVACGMVVVHCAHAVAVPRDRAERVDFAWREVVAERP